MERLCVFHGLLIWCLVLMSPGEEWSNCFTLNDISVPMNPFIGLSAMTGDITDSHEYAFYLPSSSELSDSSATPSVVLSLLRYLLPSSPPRKHRATNFAPQHRAQAGSRPSLAS